MVTTRRTTAAKLFEMGNDARFELILEELISVSPASYKANLVSDFINWKLYGFVREHGLGAVSVAEAGFLVEVDPGTVVAPDIAFVARDRMPNRIPERWFLAVVPDLVAEVISPTDECREIERKEAGYRRVAVPMIWWIDPAKELAWIHRLGRPIEHLDRTGVLDGGSVVPGFALALADAFAEG